MFVFPSRPHKYALQFCSLPTDADMQLCPSFDYRSLIYRRLYTVGCVDVEQQLAWAKASRQLAVDAFTTVHHRFETLTADVFIARAELNRQSTWAACVNVVSC